MHRQDSVNSFKHPRTAMSDGNVDFFGADHIEATYNAVQYNQHESL
jgi:hypothetical protein